MDLISYQQLKETHQIFLDKLKRTFPEVRTIRDSFVNRQVQKWNRQFEIDLTNLDPITLTLSCSSNDPYLWKAKLSGTITVEQFPINFLTVYSICHAIEQMSITNIIDCSSFSNTTVNIDNQFAETYLFSSLVSRGYTVNKHHNRLSIFLDNQSLYHYQIDKVDDKWILFLVIDNIESQFKVTRETYQKVVNKIYKLKSTSPTRFKSIVPKTK